MKTKLYALIGRILTLLAFVLAVLLATGVRISDPFVSSPPSSTTTAQSNSQLVGNLTARQLPSNPAKITAD
jgi:hypothetical protein